MLKIYRATLRDGELNRKVLEERGKLKCPVLAVGSTNFIAEKVKARMERVSEGVGVQASIGGRVSGAVGGGVWEVVELGFGIGEPLAYSYTGHILLCHGLPIKRIAAPFYQTSSSIHRIGLV